MDVIAKKLPPLFTAFLFTLISLLSSAHAADLSPDNDVRNAEIVFQELESKGKLTEHIIRLLATTLLGFSIVVAGGLLTAGRLSWGAAIAIIAGGMVMGAAAHIAQFLTGFGG